MDTCNWASADLSDVYAYLYESIWHRSLKDSTILASFLWGCIGFVIGLNGSLCNLRNNIEAYDRLEF